MFSVIIPLYNKEKYIERAVYSVLNQSIKNFELIIVNDNSTDNSLKIVENISDLRIKIFNRINNESGGYAARNLGISKSKFEYICFLDADDYWNPDFLKEINNLIKKYPEEKVFSTAWKEKSGNIEKTNSYFNRHKNKGIHLITDFYKQSSAGCNPIHTITLCVKKSVIIEAGLFPEGKCKRGGDIETWMRLMLKNNLVWTPYIVAVYSKDIDNSVTKSISDFAIPYIYFSSQNILNNLNTEKAFLIKKYSNYYSKISILHSIVFNINKKIILNGFYKEVDFWFYLFFRILKIFPSFILKLFYLIYRKLMLKFSKNDLG